MDRRGAPQLDGPRTLRADEMAAADRLSVQCFHHSTLSDLPVGPYRATRQQSVEVIAAEDVPVSQMQLFYNRLSICGSRLKVASIGGVCTEPEYRGQGLATKLLGHCLRKAKTNGARVVLISGKRGLYRRAGCTPALDFESVVLRSSFAVQECPGISVRPATSDDSGLCAQICHMEPVHFVRRSEDFRSTMGSEAGGAQGDDWIVEVDGKPVAYALLRTPWSHGPEDRVRELAPQGEYAGSRTALVAALPLIMKRCDLKELWLAAPWQDSDLRLLLRREGLARTPTALKGHTVRVLDLPGLMSDLRGYVAARIPLSLRRGLKFDQRGDRYTVTRGSERLALDGVETARLVFGGPDEAQWSVAGPGGALGDILSALFPLPSFSPGLNCR